VEQERYREVQRTASHWLNRYREGTLPSVIPTKANEADIVQVADGSGRVVATNEAINRGVPVSGVRPPPDDRIRNFIECKDSGCLLISAMRVDESEDSAVVYAAVSAPPLLTGHVLEYSLLLLGLVLLAAASWASWMLMGRAVRPVEEIRAGLAAITASDLGPRIPVPESSKELADLARTSNETLVRLEKAVEEQRRFSSDVAHELRNPIAGLRLRLEDALMDRGSIDPWEVIESSLGSAEQLSAIVDDLLTIARLQVKSPEIELIDLGGLTAARAPLISSKIEVDAPSGLLVRGNRIRLARLLANLLHNAVRHADTRVDVKVEREGDQVLLSVTDDGAGVAEADREKIFDRFVRLEESKKRDPGGTGLGLPISRDIAREHSGTLVLADSERGARFELRLPLVSADDFAEEGPDRPAKGDADHLSQE